MTGEYEMKKLVALMLVIFMGLSLSLIMVYKVLQHHNTAVPVTP